MHVNSSVQLLENYIEENFLKICIFIFNTIEYTHQISLNSNNFEFSYVFNMATLLCVAILLKSLLQINNLFFKTIFLSLTQFIYVSMVSNLLQFQ